MPYPYDKNKLEKWERGISHEVATDRSHWDEYDSQIQRVTAVYNRHLNGVAGYIPLNWEIVKAMIWVETGTSPIAWEKAPMQIGVNGDPGLRELLTSAAGKLILPPEYAKVLTMANVPVDPTLNIEAGVGYLLKILATFGFVPDSAPAPFPSVAFSFASPTFSSSLLEFLPPPPASTPFAFATLDAAMPADAALFPFSMSPSPADGTHSSKKHAAKKIHSKPKKHLTIVGWKPFTLDYIARHYNAGDGNYPGKLQYCLDIIQGKITPQALPAKPAAAPTAGRAPAHP
jgi:hypothetical protein